MTEKPGEPTPPPARRARWGPQTARRLLAAAVAAAFALAAAPATPWATATLARLGESIYGVVVAWTPPPRGASPLTIVEVDQATIDALGWPIPRRALSDWLERLAAHGKPWVLSLLRLQRLASAPSDDAALASAMARYGRVIGSGLEVAADGTAGLDDDAARLVARRGAVAAGRTTRQLAATLADLPLALVEAPPFAGAEARIGLPLRFGTEPTIRCATALLRDKAKGSRGAALALPSAALWTAQLARGASLALAPGAAPVLAGPTPAAPVLVGSPKVCLPDGRATTLAYLAARGVERRSLVEELRAPAPAERAGGVVLLASADMRRFVGPGRASDAGSDDGIVSEHLLVARFLDAWLADALVARDDGPSAGRDVAWPLALAALAGLAAWRWRLVGVAATLAAGVPTLLAVTAYARFWEARYLVPTRIWAGDVSALTLVAAYAARRAYGRLRRERTLLARLTAAWARTNDVAALAQTLRDAVAAQWPGATAQIEVADAAAGRDASDGGEGLPTCEWGAPPSAPRPRSTRGERRVAVTAAIGLGRAPLGTARVAVAAHDDDVAFVTRVARAALAELAVHWGRVAAHERQMAAEARRAELARELALGQAVQALLLPEAREGRLGAYRYRFRFAPYGPMSGDWFQLVAPRPEAGGVLFVGDVVGKGASAALVTAAIAAELARLGAAADPSPAAVQAWLAELGRVIGALFRGAQATTISVAVVRGEALWLAQIAAPRWVHFHADGDVEPLTFGGGAPLGLGAATPAAPTAFALPERHVLAAFTDGVPGAHQPRARLRDARGDGASLVERIDAAFTAGPADPRDDDATVLLLERAA
jgi:hypothetical protein